MLGTLFATAGSLSIIAALTGSVPLHHWQLSHICCLASLWAAGLAISTIWQFNIGTLILESYCVIISLHTIYLNMRRKRKS